MSSSSAGSRLKLVLRSKPTVFTAVSLAGVFVLFISTRLWYSSAEYHDVTADIPHGPRPAPHSTSQAPYHEGHLLNEFNQPVFSIGKKVAAIVETRAMDTLIPLILHFSTVLGPSWPIVLFTSATTYFASAPFHRSIDEGRIQVILIPDEVQFTNSESVSSFLAGSWFWEQLAPADHVLLFQSDSIICSNSPHTVDDFLDYDFVGAPIAPEWGHGYNGGLSLRNRNLMLEIVRKNNFTQEFLDGRFDSGVEDQWFYNKSLELPPKADGSPGALLAPYDVAGQFAVETIYYEKPLGYHQVRRWQEEHMDEVEKWCPEYRLSTGDFIAAQTPPPMNEGTISDEETPADEKIPSVEEIPSNKDTTSDTKTSSVEETPLDEGSV